MCIGAVVLGMGRSGTSAITRGLVAAGFYAGAEGELMVPDPSNPVGYYENLGIYRINEAILERTDASWFVPPAREAQVAAAADARLALGDALARLRRDGGGAPLAIKDPRIGVLLEVWEPLIVGELHPVLAVRNPVEIAFSLATRDGTPIALALASWELHMARVLRYLRDRDVTVAPYSWLVGSREAVSGLVESVALELADDCARRVDPGLAARAINPELYRNRAQASSLDDHLTGHQRDLWSYLEALPAGTQRLTMPEELTREGEHAFALTRAESRRVETERRVGDLEGNAANESQRAEEAELVRDRLAQQLEGERGRTGEAEAARDEARLAHRQAEHWLSEIQTSASWRLTAPLRAILRSLRRLRARLPPPC